MKKIEDYFHWMCRKCLEYKYPERHIYFTFFEGGKECFLCEDVVTEGGYDPEYGVSCPVEQ